MWWKYAIKCVLKLQREKKGSIYEFRIPKSKKRDYEVKFMKLFKQYLKNEDYDKELLDHIITSVDQLDLEKWVTVITKMQMDTEEKKKNEAGWFGFFKKKSVEENKDQDIISPEEIEEIYKTLNESVLK